MSERTDVDRALATWLRSEAPLTPPDDLLGMVFEVTSASRPMPAWRALLSVPSMRTQATVLVGSPVLRLARVLTVLVVLAGLIAGAAVVGAGLLRPPEHALSLGGCQPTLPDGLVVRIDHMLENGEATRGLLSDGWFLAVSPIANGDPRRTARRMTDAGIRRYLGAIEDEGPIGDCRRLYWRAGPLGPIVRLRAVVGDDVVDTIYEGGMQSATFRVLDARARAAAEDLITRLEHPETWLPADAWLVSDEQRLEPSQAIVLFSTSGAWSPQSNLGVAWPRGPDANSPPAGSFGAGEVAADPCGLLDLTSIAAIIPGYWRSEGAIPSDVLPGGGTRCWFREDPSISPTPESPGEYWRSFAVTVRSVRTDTAEAATLVAELFGPTQAEPGLTDGELWINQCFIDAPPGPNCTPAIAVASEPYFVLLTEVPDTEYSREQLRALAVEVLRNVRTLAEAASS